MSTRPTIDIIIPSYNGKHLLEKHLPQVFKNSPEINQIIIVDDGSVDGSLEWLKEKYPSISVVRHSKNIGFTISINIGVKKSQADYVILLNNDVSPLPEYIKNALVYFEDKKVFAVSFNEEKSSWPLVTWDGKISFTRGEDKSISRNSAWASGGSAIFRKYIWDKIGGFNEIYAPAYWEDIDIGYRAWKKGYKIIWNPTSKVRHEHEASYSKFNPNYINTIKQRNELLFNWINITDSKLMFDHVIWLFKHSVSHPGYLRIIFLALTKYIFQGSKIRANTSDAEVLSLVNLSRR